LSRLSLPRAPAVVGNAAVQIDAYAGTSSSSGAAAEHGGELAMLASRCALQNNAKTITALRNKHGVTVRCVDSKYAHFILSCRLAVDVLSQQSLLDKSTKDRVMNLSSEYNRP
jgi:hypothetical protein